MAETKRRWRSSRHWCTGNCTRSRSAIWPENALVNEAYLRLVDCGKVNWQDRAHFFAVSAQLMRRILIDFARSRGYLKRGGAVPHISLEEAPSVCNEPDVNLVALDDA
ncbi:MAG: ECF-type sigma factor [Candidatus Sulfotelmatobacter sp.]